MIRKADFSSDEDIAYLVSAKEKGFIDSWDDKMILSGIKAGNLLGLIYEKNKNPCAFLLYTKLPDNVIDLDEIFVEENERKNGIGSALLDRFICDTGGVEKKIFLEVRKSNIIAIGLYKKFGFVKISERKKYYTDGEDAIVMLKYL